MSRNLINIFASAILRFKVTPWSSVALWLVHTRSHYLHDSLEVNKLAQRCCATCDGSQGHNASGQDADGHTCTPIPRIYNVIFPPFNYSHKVLHSLLTSQCSPTPKRFSLLSHARSLYRPSPLQVPVAALSIAHLMLPQATVAGASTYLSSPS